MDDLWGEALQKVVEAAEAVRKAAAEDGQRAPEAITEALSKVLGHGAEEKEKAAEEKRIKLMEQHQFALHSKLDKITRQLDAMAENQAKANKVGKG